MAYELATGRLPFVGPSVPQLLIAQLRDHPTAPRSLDPDLPQAMEDLILRALAKRPEDRYPDMAAFAAASSACSAPAPPPATGSGQRRAAAGGTRAGPRRTPPRRPRWISFAAATSRACARPR
jgi:serine/threonine-protein kinase